LFKLKPVTPDMLNITWDGNDATIPGTMLKIQEWIARTGHSYSRHSLLIAK
jgi:hypothetical protein